jgi:hypothetical protein
MDQKEIIDVLHTAYENSIDLVRHAESVKSYITKWLREGKNDTRLIYAFSEDMISRHISLESLIRNDLVKLGTVLRSILDLSEKFPIYDT